MDSRGEIRREGEAFRLTRGINEAYARVVSPQQIEIGPATYPGAESYGPFLEAVTEPTRAAQVLTVLVPRKVVKPTLVANPGFERGFLGWKPRGGKDRPNHHIDTQVFRSGKQSGRVDGSGYYYTERFYLPPGTRVRGHAWFKTTPLAAGKGPTMTFYFWKNRKSFARQRVGPLGGTGWTLGEAEAVVPEGTEEMALALEFFAEGSCWFDDVEIMADIPRSKVALPEIEPIDRGEKGVIVTFADQRHVISWGGQTGRPDATGIGTDGRLAVVSLDSDGQIVSAAMLDGTYLRHGAQEVLAAGTRTSACATRRRGKLEVVAYRSLKPHAEKCGPDEIGLRVGLR